MNLCHQYPCYAMPCMLFVTEENYHIVDDFGCLPRDVYLFYFLLGRVMTRESISRISKYIFMPPDRMIGGILFLSCLFVCLSVCCQL